MSERFPAGQGHLADLRPGHARNGVEVHAQLVGVVDVVGTHRPRIDLEAAQRGGPHDVRGVVHYGHQRVTAARERDRRDLNPLGRSLRQALLIEGALTAIGDPGGEAVQDLGAIPAPGQRRVGHGRPVLNDLELRNGSPGGVGEVDLLRVRDPDIEPVDLQELFRCGHEPTVPVNTVSCDRGRVTTADLDTGARVFALEAGRCPWSRETSIGSTSW